MTPLTNAIATVKPWVLVVGRKRQLVKKPMRLELESQIAGGSIDDPPDLPMFVFAESLKLFIDDKLFSTALIAPHKRYGRFSVKVKKPKRKPLEVHLTKKLNRFAN